MVDRTHKARADIIAARTLPKGLGDKYESEKKQEAELLRLIREHKVMLAENQEANLMAAEIASLRHEKRTLTMR